jgi:hypothetical protein
VKRLISMVVVGSAVLTLATMAVFGSQAGALSNAHDLKGNWVSLRGSGITFSGHLDLPPGTLASNAPGVPQKITESGGGRVELEIEKVQNNGLASGEIIITNCVIHFTITPGSSVADQPCNVQSSIDMKVNGSSLNFIPFMPSAPASISVVHGRFTGDTIGETLRETIPEPKIGNGSFSLPVTIEIRLTRRA